MTTTCNFAGTKGVARIPRSSRVSTCALVRRNTPGQLALAVVGDFRDRDTSGWVRLLDLGSLERLGAEHPSADLTQRIGDLVWRPPRSGLESSQGEKEMTSLIEANFDKWEAGLVQQGVERGIAQGRTEARAEHRAQLGRLAGRKFGVGAAARNALAPARS